MRKSGLGDTSAVQAIVRNTAAKYGISQDLLLAVARQESGFNPGAVSPAGAQGVMQLMPATARGLGVSDPFDPLQNVDAGARYLSQLLNQFNGDVSLALAAYNAGPGNVQKYGGIPPFPETQNYVASILARSGAAAPAADEGVLPIAADAGDVAAAEQPETSSDDAGGLNDAAKLGIALAAVGLLAVAVMA